MGSELSALKQKKRILLPKSKPKPREEVSADRRYEIFMESILEERSGLEPADEREYQKKLDEVRSALENDRRPKSGRGNGQIGD